MKIMKKTVLLFIIIGALFTSCTGSNIKTKSGNYDSDINEKYKFGIALKDYNCGFKFPDDKTVIEIADKITYKSELIVFDTMKSLHYELNNFDWNIQYTESPSTFQLYLQCLNSIVYLTKGFQISGNVEYLDMAAKIIKSWSNYESDKTSWQNNSFVWYDHGTALRAENLIYYALVAEESSNLDLELKELIVNLLNRHGDFLSTNENYTENHNHGIFQDRSLIYISYFLNNENKDKWIEIAKKRLEEQIKYAFTDEMVHVENSPGYQIGVMDMFRMISEFLLQYDDEYGQLLYNDIKKAAEFMAYITKPNGLVAEIGDTNSLLSTSSVSNSKLSIFNNPYLTYASTKGEIGEKPERNSVIYQHSGYYISHNDWKKEGFIDSTWAMFKSGFSSKTHKHADDLSFMLYSKGYDIFVDTGWYNYMTGNRYRDYFVSSLAHNTLIVDEKTYSATSENSIKTGIVDYKHDDNYDHVVGFNDMYNGVKIDRHFYNLGEAFIIHDNILSEEEHNYSQLFHASEYMEIISKSDEEVLLKLADTGYNVRVRQILDNTKLNIIKGDFDKEKYGYISREMNHLDSISTLKFDVKGSNVDIITLITIEDKSGNVQDIKSINFDIQNKTFSVTPYIKDKFLIDIGARERMKLNDISISNKSDNFKFINNCVNQDYTYSWYIVNKENAEVINKTEYSSENTFNYCFDKKGEYLVKAYIKNKIGNRKSAIVADIKFDTYKGQWNVITQNDNFLNLKYNGHSYKKINGNEYKFTIDYNYFWNSKIKWYIYRNGGYHTNFTSDNENSMTYKFEEPGDYTVMYYLTTPNGDNEFWNFEQITIN